MYNRSCFFFVLLLISFFFYNTLFFQTKVGYILGIQGAITYSLTAIFGILFPTVFRKQCEF